MTITMSSREFNQDTSGAKKAAEAGPVFITDRGRQAYVLLSIEAYRQLTGSTVSLVDALVMPEMPETQFEPQRANIAPRPVELG